MHHTMMDFPLTLPHLLERARSIFGQVELVSQMPDYSMHRYKYTDFYRRTLRLAEALQSLGLHKGEPVGTLMWNHHRHLESYFAIPNAGGVLHTLNVRLHPQELSYIMDHAGDRFLIVDDVLLPLLEKLETNIPPQRTIVCRLTDGEVPPDCIDFEELLASASGRFSYPNIEETDPLGMCYTSGTTGRPKGVVYSHRSQMIHTLGECLPDSLDLSQRDTVLAVVPMFHANAWGLPFSCTMVGCKQVFPGPHLDPESLLNLFEKEQVTFAAGVPTIWFGILQLLQSNPGRWQLPGGMRTAVGGSAVPESVLRAFDAQGIRILHAWGMTEISPLGTVSFVKSTIESLSEDEKYQYRSRQGIPAPWVEIRADNEEGEVPWDDETMGELLVRGPWVAGSYYNNPESKTCWTDDGWFRTGDVVTIHEEGYISIVDRSKDLIKSGGEWISSVDLESALMDHPAVSEAAVIAVPDPRWQERPLAVIVPAQGAAVDVDELKEHLAKHFSSWQLPDHFQVVDEIPRTSTGKFKKTALREQFAKRGT